MASFFNLTHASVDADAQAWAYVQGRAEAVPAPTSFALLLGGLFCLGGVVRQRRSGWGCKEVASAAACAVGLLVATGAQATSWSSATLSNLHLTLVDLDLNDGIAPAVMIDAGSARSFVSADAHDFASGGAAASKYGTSAFDPVSVAVSHGTGSASAALSGNGPMLGMALNTSGSTSGYLDATSTDYERQGFYAAKASTSFFQFTLTPMTRLIWSGDAVISAERNAPPDFDLDSASAAASLAFNNLGGPAPVGSYDNISVLTVGDPTNHIAYDERRLEVSFFNLSTLSATATGWANVQVDGYAMGTSVVPEPATPLLWLMGIAAVAGRRYRHS